MIYVPQMELYICLFLSSLNYPKVTVIIVFVDGGSYIRFVKKGNNLATIPWIP